MAQRAWKVRYTSNMYYSFVKHEEARFSTTRDGLVTGIVCYEFLSACSSDCNTYEPYVSQASAPHPCSEATVLDINRRLQQASSLLLKRSTAGERIVTTDTTTNIES